LSFAALTLVSDADVGDDITWADDDHWWHVCIWWKWGIMSSRCFSSELCFIPYFLCPCCHCDRTFV